MVTDAFHIVVYQLNSAKLVLEYGAGVKAKQGFLVCKSNAKFYNTLLLLFGVFSLPAAADFALFPPLCF